MCAEAGQPHLSCQAACSTDVGYGSNASCVTLEPTGENTTWGTALQEPSLFSIPAWKHKIMSKCMRDSQSEYTNSPGSSDPDSSYTHHPCWWKSRVIFIQCGPKGQAWRQDRYWWGRETAHEEGSDWSTWVLRGARCSLGERLSAFRPSGRHLKPLGY